LCGKPTFNGVANNLLFGQTCVAAEPAIAKNDATLIVQQQDTAIEAVQQFGAVEVFEAIGQAGTLEFSLVHMRFLLTTTQQGSCEGR
jgi:hypothetical protein